MQHHISFTIKSTSFKAPCKAQKQTLHCIKTYYLTLKTETLRRESYSERKIDLYKVLRIAQLLLVADWGQGTLQQTHEQTDLQCSVQIIGGLLPPDYNISEFPPIDASINGCQGRMVNFMEFAGCPQGVHSQRLNGQLCNRPYCSSWSINKNHPATVLAPTPISESVGQ